MMKRIVTIQDISCVGKCSLTVALPIISAMGVETAILPTAVLSTHTQFKNFTFHDLTGEITPISDTWKKEQIDFDAIYTGYLGSFEQINLMIDFFRDHKKAGTITIVDPAMGDNGVLYKGFDPAFAREMARLCAKADVILPNLTEASYMLDIPYAGSDYDEDYIRNVLKQLTGLGAKNAVITGVKSPDGRIGVMGYLSEEDRYFSYYNTHLPVSFHGTGDIFSSTTVGAMMNGLSLEDALKVAVDYTLECIRLTMENENHRFYGVDFEAAVPYLLKRLGKV